MEKEIEVKFLQIDIELVRKKLLEAGGVLKVPMRIMRRIMIKTDEMHKDNSFLRVRDEGNKVTMTYKKFDQQSVDGCNELEVTVGDFEKTIEILKLVGLPYVTYQESRRETWDIDGTEVVIDEWPWIKPYIEIEGSDEAILRDVAKKLGFSWDEASFGSVMRAYEAEYPSILKNNILLSDIAEVKFALNVPNLLID